MYRYQLQITDDFRYYIERIPPDDAVAMLELVSDMNDELWKKTFRTWYGSFVGASLKSYMRATRYSDGTSMNKYLKLIKVKVAEE